MRTITAGSLQRLLADLSPDTPVLFPAPDHTYREVERVSVTEVPFCPDTGWHEEGDGLEDLQRRTAVIIEQ